ncbi:MAG: ABC transporter permease [Dehalococcoidia bacterium]|nr:ABC transporter permease [Dehalococcoidia bacterium]
MQYYLIRRASHSVFIVLGLMALLFFMIHILGDPVALQLPEDVDPKTIKEIQCRLGYCDPLHIQFVNFYWDVLRFDFGNSVRNGVPAMTLVAEKLPNTAFLAFVVWGIGMVGIPIGVIAAQRPRSIFDRLVNLFTFAAISVPGFWLALMLILIFAVWVRVLPTSGFAEFPWDTGWQSIKYLILPAIALCPNVIARNAQITRATMLDEMGKQYVATARAKGLSERTVQYGHVMKNASIAIVTVMGDELALYMNGSTVVEVIFASPGLGLLIINGINDRDLPVVTASIFVIVLIVLVINLLVDVVYTYLDPRISYK